ncbi:MAG: protein-L-isoaspartate O-methyltransferase family protein [Nanobdellota archaeon]
MSRQTMLRNVDQILGTGNENIFEAFERIDRAWFVDAPEPYLDSPLPIGEDQTISQPSTVAYMLKLSGVEKGDKVLEIGTGSGWNAALIKQIVGKKGEVITSEKEKALAEKAVKNLSKAGIDDVRVQTSDFRNIKEKFDIIIFTAGMTELEKREVTDFGRKALKDDGRLICPRTRGPVMIMDKREGKESIEQTGESFVFVPLRL